MAKQSNLLLTKNSKTMKHSKKNQTPETTTTMEGLMTLGMTDNGLKMLDFMCTEYVEMESFTADCRVQAMRDGNVYITEKPRRLRNTPLFREDNSSLTLGRDHRYYFVFTLPKERVKELPDKLVHQALAIAQKVTKMNTKRGGRK
jgi:hypothetical protein